MNESTPLADIRVALTGAAGGFGRTVLAALRHHPIQRPAVVCDLDVGALKSSLESLGYARSDLVLCETGEQVCEVVERRGIALVDSIDLLEPAAFDVLVEATGSVGVSVRAALAAIDGGRPVVMASKETESLFGRALAERAERNGVVSTTGAGDQPANLVALLEWARRLGLDVVAAGKSSEYDLVFDPADGRASVLEESIAAPRLADAWELGEDIAATLSARREAVRGLKLGAAADYCEIAVVANLTGMAPDTPSMHYPIARYAELADIFRARDEGGILSSTGVLDVFVLLREPSEVSFAGGEFIVVRCPDPEVAQVLRQKGHVVSRSGDHLCIGLPFHLMGLELPGTIAEAIDGRAVARPHDRRTRMIGTAAHDLPVGTVLRVGGHHHEIHGLSPSLVPAAEAAGLAPFYLLDGARLTRHIAAGEPLDLDSVTDIDPLLLSLAEHDHSGASPRTAKAAS